MHQYICIHTCRRAYLHSLTHHWPGKKEKDFSTARVTCLTVGERLRILTTSASHSILHERKREKSDV